MAAPIALVRSSSLHQIDTPRDEISSVTSQQTNESPLSLLSRQLTEQMMRRPGGRLSIDRTHTAMAARLEPNTKEHQEWAEYLTYKFFKQDSPSDEEADNEDDYVFGGRKNKRDLRQNFQYRIRESAFAAADVDSWGASGDRRSAAPLAVSAASTVTSTPRIAIPYPYTSGAYAASLARSNSTNGPKLGSSSSPVSTPISAGTPPVPRIGHRFSNASKPGAGKVDVGYFDVLDHGAFLDTDDDDDDDDDEGEEDATALAGLTITEGEEMIFGDRSQTPESTHKSEAGKGIKDTSARRQRGFSDTTGRHRLGVNRPRPQRSGSDQTTSTLRATSSKPDAIANRMASVEASVKFGVHRFMRKLKKD